MKVGEIAKVMNMSKEHVSPIRKLTLRCEPGLLTIQQKTTHYMLLTKPERIRVARAGV